MCPSVPSYTCSVGPLSFLPTLHDRDAIAMRSAVATHLREIVLASQSHAAYRFAATSDWSDACPCSWVFWRCSTTQCEGTELMDMRRGALLDIISYAEFQERSRTAILHQLCESEPVVARVYNRLHKPPRAMQPKSAWCARMGSVASGQASCREERTTAEHFCRAEVQSRGPLI